MARSEQITLRDVYDVMQRLEDKMDERLKAVENKVDVLESIASKAMIVFGIISTIGSAVFSYVWQKIAGGKV